MRKIILIIKQRWLKEGALTALLIAIIVAAYFLLNALFIKLNIKPLDFTSEKKYSLSQDSKDRISKVNLNVSIYLIGYESDSEPAVLANQYEKINDKIKYSIVNASENPALLQKFGISIDSSSPVIIVAQGDNSERMKAISSSDLYSYDDSTGESEDLIEQKITNAILDVTVDEKPKVYFVSGNGEFTPENILQYFKIQLENEINEVDIIDLSSKDIPSDCTDLVIANVTQDFLDTEANKIITYINNGGKILWTQNPYLLNQNSSDNFPNMQKILDLFGISFSKGLVLESDSNYSYESYPNYLSPKISYHEITKDIYKTGKLLFINSGRLNFVDDSKQNELGLKIDKLVTSSDKSYYKEDLTNSNSTNALAKNSSNEEGSFTLGALITKKIDDKKSAKLIAIADTLFITDYSPSQNSSSNVTMLGVRNNKDLALNSIAYLSEKEDSITIRKTNGTVSFSKATTKQATIVLVIIFAIPILLILSGIIVPIVRKRKK